MLSLTVDLGEGLPLSELGELLEDLQDLWTHSVCASLVVNDDAYATDLRARQRPEERDFRSQLALQNYAADLAATSIRLHVRRFRIASPLEAVVFAAAERSQWVLYTATAIYGFERLMRLLMEWQTHRADLESRRRSSSGQPLDRDEMRDLARRIASEMANEPNLEPLPTEQKAAEALRNVQRRRIMSVELVDEDEPA